MPPTILHISGPPASGKTTLARRLAALVQPAEPDYIRFDLQADASPARLRIARTLPEMASSTHRNVNPKLVFEQVADTLKTVATGHDHALVFIETDAQPCFRHAYPYHVTLFVMSPPAHLGIVFRSPTQTAQAIQRAMDDTSEFAAELFGLGAGPQDSATGPAIHPKDRKPQPTQSVEDFLSSDVGTEIAARMQLQPEYHAIMDSDVILLNVAQPGDRAVTARCVTEIDRLLETIRRRLGRQNWFAACNLLDQEDLIAKRALQRVKQLLQAAKAGPQ